ncbi:MAG TPA: T9SS type A sorting domain-containing protein, partial [bacterium]
HFYFYQNNGTPQWPAFSLVTSQWQGIEDPGGWRGFCFGDLDEDGDLDLLMAQHTTYQQDANLRFYRNDGTPQSASMILVTPAFLQDSVGMACPYLLDIDLDGDLDLFCGEYGGGVIFFRNVTGEPPGVPPAVRHPQAGLHLSLGPNPANPVTVVSCQFLVPSNISLQVFDISGRMVVELASGFHLPGEYRYVWDAGNRAAGRYFVRLRAGEERIIEKVVMLK